MNSGKSAIRIGWIGLGVIFMASLAVADVIQIDVNDAYASPGAAWNTIASPGGPTALLNTEGEATGISITFDSGFNDSGSGVPSTAWPTEWFNAAGDYFYVRKIVGGKVGTITLTGMNDSIAYKIELVASISVSYLGDYRVNGAFGDGSSPNNGDDFDAYNDGYARPKDTGIVMQWSSVQSSSGEMQITVTQVSDEDYDVVTLNAIRITEVPEPTTLALVAVGAVLYCRRKKTSV